MWTLDEWSEALPKAKIMGELTALSEVESFFIDSRSVPKRGFFVPLKGERTDGHRFLSSAIKNGARASFCSEAEFPTFRDLLQEFPDLCFVIVPDVLKALQEFATAHVRRLDSVTRIGITGSNGKTTTKEMMAAVLRNHGETFYTEGNFNSEIGLPLTVLKLNRNYRFAVLELGINHEGEMDALASVARPHLSIITNVGTAHIGILGSQHKIALEKKKIFSQSGSDSHAILPAEDAFLSVLKQGYAGKVHLFGESQPGFRKIEDLGLAGTRFSWQGTEIALHLPGIHNVRNALAVLTAGELLGVPIPAMKKGLESLRASFGRSQVLQGAVTLLRDCYNANFDSMVSLISMLESLETGQRMVVVLGSMRELGSESERLHRELGLTSSRLKADALFFFGEETEVSYETCVKKGFGQRLFWTSDYTQLEAEVKAFVQDGDLVVLKGSRGVELERLSALWFDDKEKESDVL